MFELDFIVDCDREENCLVFLFCVKLVEFFRIIVKEGVNLYVMIFIGKNVLYVVCEYGRFDVVKFFVENIKDNFFFFVEILDGYSVIYFILCVE